MYQTGIVLSGGGARGFSHLGVLQALNEADIFPDCISGTSSGSIAGVFYADGYKPIEIIHILSKNKRFDYLSFAIPKNGLLEMTGMQRILEKYIRARTFKDLKIPLYVAATDLNHGKIKYFHQGTLIEKVEADVLGDAYEYLIGQFASGAGKKAGEFYTPQAVSKVLAKLVTTGKTKLRSVYDPTCGSGSLLLRVAREVQEVTNFYGQELNRTTYNLARMNMILHDVHYRKFDIRQEDTLEHPQHIDKRFEAIVANPPFSAQWSASPLFMSDDRFSQYGKLAPSSKADFAFVQHMIYQLSENGTMAIVLPHGALFRGGAEQHIRKYLIEDRNYLDAVIGLPANIFYGTSIPTCILIFKKCRENPEDVLFIDASQHFEKVKTQNHLRDEDINKIVAAYRNRSEEDKYSKRVKTQSIVENDYNLNIPRYVDTFEAEDSIDINKLASELVEFDRSMKETDIVIAGFCKELNISPPF